MSEVKKALSEGTAPKTLDAFWTGKLRYGLSGSMVAFVDQQYGRTKLKELLNFNRRKQVMDALGTTEAALLSGWAK